MNPNESYQEIDSELTNRLQNNTKNSIHQNQFDDFLLYAGPSDILIESNKLRFCEKKVLNKIDQNKTNNIKTINEKSNIYQTNLNKIQDNKNQINRINNISKINLTGLNSNSNIINNPSSNRTQNSGTVRKISIIHGSKNNSFGLHTSVDKKRFSQINNISKDSNILTNHFPSSSRQNITIKNIQTSLNRSQPNQIQNFNNKSTINSNNQRITSKPYTPKIIRENYYSNQKPRTNTIVKRIQRSPVQNNYISERKISSKNYINLNDISNNQYNGIQRFKNIIKSKK